MLLPATADNNEASIRQRLSEELRTRNARPARRYALCISVGVVASDSQRTSSVEEMLAQADALMYVEKQRGRVSR